ncbi:threonine/serine exporter family protein [Kitasatospora sp. NPDC004669]|uniref:threonine/serine ThrE exporter family protein n=1 Tax=Kitasatospora sp. NPDC004669 TaxID=3154555 RepID=UPI0033A14C44
MTTTYEPLTVRQFARRTTPANEDAGERLLLALRTGELLLAGGAPAADVVATTTAMAAALGLHGCAADVTAGSLSLSYRSGPRAVPLTEIRVVRTVALDYSRIDAVHRLVEQVGRGPLDVRGVRSRLAQIEAARPAHPAWQVTLAWAALGGFFTVMLGGGPTAFAAAAAVAAFIDRANHHLSHRGVPGFHQVVLGGAVATATATALFLTDATTQAPLVVAGGIAMLLPGLAFVSGVQDAIAGYLVTAAARALEAAMTVAAIVAGVGAVLYTAVRSGLRAPQVQPGDFALHGWAALLLEIPAAMMVCVCLAFCLQATRWNLLTAGLAGALAWTVYLVLWQEYRLPPPLAAAVAATLVGLGTQALAHRTNTPALLLTVAGIAPLAPGYTIYQGMLCLSHGQLAPGLLTIGQAAAIGLAIAGGLTLGYTTADQLAPRSVHRHS